MVPNLFQAASGEDSTIQLAALQGRGDACIKQGTSHAVMVQLAVLGEQLMAHSCSPMAPMAC